MSTGKRSTRRHWFAFLLAATFATVATTQAVDIVRDTWQDGERDTPAAPTYSENGVDGDNDTDIESAWFNGGNGGLFPSTGHLVMSNATTSSTWTTYFTPEASPITLASAGDQLKLTWVFTPTGVNANNTSQNFRLALVDSPSAARISTDVSPGSALYTGYSMFMNMGQTLGNSNPYQLREFVTTSSAFLSASGAWTALANGASSGNTGYASGTEYTFVMTLTRTASSELDIVATMTGGNLNGAGFATVSFTDTTPSGFTYDTFGIRPSDAGTTAAFLDTTLFKVEFIPEPSSVALAAMGIGVLLAAIRRRR